MRLRAVHEASKATLLSKCPEPGRRRGREHSRNMRRRDLRATPGSGACLLQGSQRGGDARKGHRHREGGMIRGREAEGHLMPDLEGGLKGGGQLQRAIAELRDAAGDADRLRRSAVDGDGGAAGLGRIGRQLDDQHELALGAGVANDRAGRDELRVRGRPRLVMNEADPGAGVGPGLGNQAVQGPGFVDLAGKGRGRRAGLGHGCRPAQNEDEAGGQDPEERRPGHLSQ